MSKIFDLAVNTLTEWVWAKDLNNITEGFEIGSKYHYRAVVFAQEIHRLTRELNTLKYQAKKDKAEIERLRALSLDLTKDELLWLMDVANTKDSLAGEVFAKLVEYGRIRYEIEEASGEKGEG